MISFHENVQIGRQSAGPSCSGLALLGLIVALAASSTSVCQEPRFHVETGSARHSIRILLDHDVSIRGGTVVFRLDPSKFVIEAIELGADIPQGAQLFSNLFPLPESIGEDGRIYPVIDPILVVDEEGGEVPGGVVLGWMNSLDNDVLVEAGTRREICTLSFAPVGDAESEDCPAVNLEFLTDIRVGVDSQGPLQQSIITNAESVSALANTDSAILCVCEAPVVVSQELPTAYEGEEYALHLESSGGFLDPSWELVEPSALPAGLSLDPDGRIHGVPAPRAAPTI